MALRLIVVPLLLSVALNMAWLFMQRPDVFMLPAAVLGWYLADALSGVVHMVMDYRPCTPGVGLADLFFYTGSRESADYLELRRRVMRRISFFERVVFDFKNHHPRPLALGRRNFWVQTSSIMVFALPLSLALNFAHAWWRLPSWFLAGYDVFLLGGLFSQYFHGTLHRDANPWVVLAMRRSRLLITPAAHEVHHATLDCDFSTINGWSNPLLNRLFIILQKRGHMDRAGLEPS